MLETDKYVKTLRLTKSSPLQLLEYMYTSVMEKWMAKAIYDKTVELCLRNELQLLRFSIFITLWSESWSLS